MFGGWNIPFPARPQLSDNTPREPLELTFPSCSVNSPHDPKFSKGVYQLFKQIRKLPDITPEHLECLNVSLDYDVPLEKIIPNYTLKSSSTPSSRYIPDENGETQWDRTFADRKKELLIQNEHAFETLMRLRKDIKLGHFYKFYQSLELVNTYYNPKEGAHSGMPERFREDLVKNFVEPICWGYNARLMPPRTPPRVQFQTSRFQTRLDFFAYITPSLPAERKAGLVEGPLFGIQCRHEDYFVHPGGPHCLEDSSPSPEPEIPDVPKPPATDADGDSPMEEVTSSEGDAKKDDEKGEAVEIDAKEASKKVDEANLAKIEEARRKAAKREEEKKIRIKKGSWPEGDVWDTLKEVGALFCTAQERRKGGKGADGIGKAIGRETTWWDDIFLISAVHCHIAITHVHLSAPYLRFLETGNLPNPDHELIKDDNSGWCEFKMQRTKWMNLADPNERVDAARAVSAILAFLVRNEA
ncbi:hypothetical protein BDZ91DRAFT_718215 [Kalaharituber pfeilii]|nr:hypothetical protein BDZ91DRAFT_718215 [Kalaharituber pfeilii]